MAFFDWNDGLATGIPLIDEQHRKLVSLVNDLHEAMRTRKAKEILGGILGELARYTDYHFSTEERAFDRYGYPRATEHRKSHASFVAKVEELIDKQARGQLTVSIEMLQFLIGWVGDHIMKEDMLYASLLKGKEIT